MRVAVTGATGFIGAALVRRLMDEGHEVLALGRRIAAPDSPATYRAYELPGGTPPPELRDAEAVVHVAAHVRDGADDGPFRRITVEGTGQLLDAIAPEARLIVIGSSSVYDPAPADHALREDEAPVAMGRYLNAYARAKADQERLVGARRPDAIVLRPRAVWGAGDRTLLPRLLRRVRHGLIPLPGGGRAPGSMTHVSTLATAVVAALGRSGVAGPVNVADATPRAPAELLEALFAARGLPLRIVPVPTSVALAAARLVEAAWSRSGEPPVSRYAIAGIAHPHTLDLSRLRGELGLAPDASLEDGIEELVRTL